MNGKPFIKWVGGKTQLLSEIERFLPKDFKDITYIEPFVGGGATLFFILNTHPEIKRVVISDINKDLIDTYKIVRDKPIELINYLQNIANEYLPLSEEDRKKYFLLKRELYNTKKLGELENSALFIFLNKTCFNGLYRVNSKGLFNSSFGDYKNPKICDRKTIIEDSKLLQKVEILNIDFEETIKYVGDNTFFYLDPPYKPISKTAKFTSYTKEAFNDEEQLRLRDFCINLDLLGYKFLLSNSDNKLFYDIYSKFIINKVYASRNISSDPDKRKGVTELLITNLKPIN
jgi:DNA adenine methylase